MIDYQALPLWLDFVGGLVLLVATNEVGRLVRKRSHAQQDDNIHTLEGAVLGLLALMVGFSFSMSLSYFEERRVAVFTQANAVSTAASRAFLLPAPHSDEIRVLLHDYVHLPLEAALAGRPMAEQPALVIRSNAIEEKLWQHAKAVMVKDPEVVPTGLFIQALNDMSDAHQRRLAAFRARLPALVVISLYGIAAVASGLMGYAGGLGPRRASFPNYAVLVLIAAVIVFVQDLDRPLAGFISVDIEPLVNVANSLAEHKE